jgi:hypothetical protein
MTYSSETATRSQCTCQGLLSDRVLCVTVNKAAHGSASNDRQGVGAAVVAAPAPILGHLAQTSLISTGHKGFTMTLRHNSLTQEHPHDDPAYTG